MPKDTKGQLVSIDGHRLRLTNLDKVMYPETGTTKGEVLAYYAAVAPVMLPLVMDRPATRKRWVHGVGTPDAPGQVFFQKNLDASTPGWVKRRTIEHSDHSNEYPLVNDLATLTWLGQVAAIEIHVPQWRFGRGGARRNPDRFVLDLDPGDGAGLAECVEVARLARTLLQDMGLDPVPVTSGSKGIHLYAALDGTHTAEEISLVAHELARALEADHPELVVSDMKKTLRTGKVLVDWSQNNGAKTTVAPYSLRGRFRPTVAAPRTWRDLEDPDLAQLELSEVVRLVEAGAEPMHDLVERAALASRRSAQTTSASRTAPTSAPVPSTGAAAADRLVAYRSKRDASRTPEPVPTPDAEPSDAEQSVDAPVEPSGQSFVVHRHDASRLHFDLRLEHDGVLVSWALPKGVPTDHTHNHLAVQTEDHPIEYGSFEGVIPKGEYGAGSMEIWDTGTYTLEKWRSDEVIVTLRGEDGGGLGGDRRFALIRTGGESGKQNWLIHLMNPADDAGGVRTTGTHVPGSHRAGARPPREAHGHRQPLGPPARSIVNGAGSTTGSRGIAPMLASAGSTLDIDAESDWAFEMKWDGIRAIANVDARTGVVHLTSRNGKDLTPGYPEIVEALLLDADAVRTADGRRVDAVTFDGEIVALDGTGRPDFARLQQRMHLTAPADVERAMARTPVRYLVFDVLEVNGDDLTSSVYTDRRAVLERLVPAGDAGCVLVPPAFEGDLRGAIDTSRELGLEGVVAKERDSRYRPGRRSGAWVKIKHLRMQEVVIGGWRPGRGRRDGVVGSLLMGVPDEDGLHYVGRVGTGFREQQLVELTTRFAAIQNTTSPFHDVPAADASDAHWITPTLVGEVTFAEWTSDGRLRQPSWRGWRPDKSPDDVAIES
ncbi:ATP-dependent DNA ligase [Plantibacter sp. Mn2098]|uniref:ATP-dependent DNA ligase n=1 Tax=Plantibacter sp. Mn2098 TaxID=3395266 RepID=UPI003BC7A8B7